MKTKIMIYVCLSLLLCIGLVYVVQRKQMPTGLSRGVRVYRAEEIAEEDPEDSYSEYYAREDREDEEGLAYYAEEDVYFGREYVEFEEREELEIFLAEQYSGEFEEAFEKTIEMQLASLTVTPVYNIREWLIASNIPRAMHDVYPLKWDEKWSKSAQKWAETKPSKWAKNSHSPGSGTTHGECIAWSSGGPAFYPLGSVFYWYNEITKYNYNNQGWSTKTGHFTQVIWKDTKFIGGGIKNNIYVCQYYPTGNKKNEFQKNVPKLKYSYNYNTPFSAFYSNSQGKWVVGKNGTTKCWQIDGHPTLGTDAGRNPNVKWILSGSNPPVVAYGEKAPPVGGLWLRKVYMNGNWIDKGGCWQSGGMPMGSTGSTTGYWKLRGYQGPEIIRHPVNGFPDLRGLKIIEKVTRNNHITELEMPACWEELDAKGNATGVYYSELGTVTTQTWSQ